MTRTQVAEWVEACDIFASAIRAAASGDWIAAGAQLATAFLLDGRSIRVGNAPPPDQPDAVYYFIYPPKRSARSSKKPRRIEE